MAAITYLSGIRNRVEVLDNITATNPQLKLDDLCKAACYLDVECIQSSVDNFGFCNILLSIKVDHKDFGLATYYWILKETIKPLD